jgi:hypothetical protein
MGRAIGGAVVGYIVMVIIVFAGLTAAWMTLGAEGAFRPGVFTLSTTWLVISAVVALLAALAGGRVSRMIAKTATGPRILAALVVVLGIAQAIPAMTADPAAAVRDAGLPMMDAIAQARTPMLMLILHPLIGALGALVGGNAVRDA